MLEVTSDGGVLELGPDKCVGKATARCKCEGSGLYIPYLGKDEHCQIVAQKDAMLLLTDFPGLTCVEPTAVTYGHDAGKAPTKPPCCVEFGACTVRVPFTMHSGSPLAWNSTPKSPEETTTVIPMRESCSVS